MPIIPNLRCVVAQVHGKSRSIGSHRNLFTLSNPIEVTVAGMKIQLKDSFLGSVLTGVGYFSVKEMYMLYKYYPTLEKRLEEEEEKLLLEGRHE